MKWNIQFTNKAAKQTRELNEEIVLVLQLLVEDLNICYGCILWGVCCRRLLMIIYRREGWGIACHRITFILIFCLKRLF